MKKKLTFILSIILCLSLIIPTFAIGPDDIYYTNTNSNAEFDTLKMTDEEYKIYQKAVDQYDAVVFYDRLMSAFIEQYGEKGGSPARYPDSYSGAYINDNGKLVIQIKKAEDLSILSKEVFNEYDIVDLNEIKKIDSEFKSDSIKNIVLFEEAAFSLNELNNILEVSVDEIKQQFLISGYGVDTVNNEVKIRFAPEVYEKAIKKIDDYKEIISTTEELAYRKEVPLKFEVGESLVTQAHHIGGQGYYTQHFCSYYYRW